MTGTDLQIIRPASREIAGADAERLPSLHTTANTDRDLLKVWLKSHADGSPHTRRAYSRIGGRFVDALAAASSNLRRATIDDVQSGLESMRLRQDGTAASAATVNMQVAAVKALLGFAHKVGYTRFNAGPLIKLRKAPRKLAQRIVRVRYPKHPSSRQAGTRAHSVRGRVLRRPSGVVAGDPARQRRGPAGRRRQRRQGAPRSVAGRHS